ncbi:MAG: redox-regulated ATPase YchF [Acidobacteriota bacterium]
MALSCGIVGSAKAGKTTIFNALTASSAEVGGFTGASADPNIGQALVPDPRLTDLGKVFKSKKITPTSLQFVDVAGLVRGSSRGGGLGNQFLAHIREVDAVVHVVRCFDDPNVPHEEGSVDPVRDAETVNLELALADLSAVERRMERTIKLARSGDAPARKLMEVLERLKAVLEEGRFAAQAEVRPEEAALLSDLFLLTVKPVIYVANVDEAGLEPGHRHASALEALAAREGRACLRICGKVEAEMALLPEADRQDFMAAYGLSESGLSKLIHAAFSSLDLMTFLTAGDKETRAWTIARGTRAPQAAGKIHSDLERGFIRLEVYSYEDWVACSRDEKKVKERGLYRSEGRDYVMREGDVCLFRFNV